MTITNTPHLQTSAPASIMAPTNGKGTLTFLLGLAGSGKSFFLRRLKYDHKFDENFAADHEFQTNHSNLITHLQNGKNCIVTELKYLNPNNREEYVTRLMSELDGEVYINYMCFENNLALANANCPGRKDKVNDPTGEDHIRINCAASPAYVIPAGAIVLKVYDPSVVEKEASQVPQLP